MVFDIIDFAGLLVLLVVIAVVWLLVRRTLLRRNGASVACALRIGDVARPGHGWHLGNMRYTPANLEWFGIFSAAFQPRIILLRSSIDVVGRRAPRGFELHSIPPGAVVARCRALAPDGRSLDLELAMGERALTGFLAWLESAAPGAHQFPDARRS